MRPTLPNILAVLSLVVNLTMTCAIYRAFSRLSGQAMPPEIEVRTVNAVHPFLDTVTVVREVGYAGNRTSSSFASSIRDKSYVVRANDTCYVLYSQHLQSLTPGTKMAGWFTFVGVSDSTQPEGKLQFISPVEMISCETPLKAP